MTIWAVLKVISLVGFTLLLCRDLALAEDVPKEKREELKNRITELEKKDVATSN